MPAFNIEVPHTLGQEEAIGKLKGFLDGVKEKFKDQISAIDGEWQENILDYSFTTFGFTISGTLTVEDDKARMEGNLPFAAVAFRGKIESAIRKELEKELGS